MALILIFGVGLGSIIRPALVQRDAVAAVERAGGRVEYDWSLTPVRIGDLDTVQYDPKAKPAWPSWIVKAVGPDYFGTVKAVYPGAKTTDGEMARIGKLSKLEFLMFHSGSELTDSGMVVLQNLPLLKQFVLGPSRKVTSASFSNLQYATQLQFVDLSENRLSEAVDLAFLQALPNLRVLHLFKCQMGDAALANLEGQNRLKILRLDSNPITSAGLGPLKGMTQLELLALRSTKVDDLKPIESLIGLKHLLLSLCPIGDAGLAPVARFTGLQTLFLDKTRVTDPGLQSLKGLRSLESVSLSWTLVGDAGLANLADLRALKMLNLSDTGITDAGLASIKDLPALDFLDIQRTTITDAGIVHLESLPPQCVINLSGIRATKGGIAMIKQSKPSMKIFP